MLASVLNGGDDSGFRFCNQHKSPVGAELAREGGVSGDNEID
jgi:hypothetical protein